MVTFNLEILILIYPYMDINLKSTENFKKQITPFCTFASHESGLEMWNQ